MNVTVPDIGIERDIERVIDTALAEDVGGGDVTSEVVLPQGANIKLTMRTREDIVVAGLDVAKAVFQRLAGDADIEMLAADGDRVLAGAVLMRLDGPARGLLTAERTALNLVQMLSGIATLTRRYVDAIEGSGAVLLDTRKTIPGLRTLSKYATRMGGAENHRMRLDDAVLIKDNHIAVAGGVAEAVASARAGTVLDIEVECDTIEQVEQALAAGAVRILLDNMDNGLLRRAVEINAGRAKLEASGGVTLENIGGIAETGVDFISVGRITQSAAAVDIGLDMDNT